MTGSFSTPPNRNLRLIFLVMCGLLTISAAVVGVNDNLPGILLAFLAATTFVLAFVHHWRIVRKFMFLILVSVIGFVIFIILNIVVDSIVQNPATPGILLELMQSPASEVFGLIIAFVSFSAFIVGAVGSVVMLIRNRRPPV